MRKMSILVFGCAFVVLLSIGCVQQGSSTQEIPSGQEVTTVAGPSEGLDLQAIGGLVRQARDAASLEMLINDPASGINNLDLDQDGQIDYISVHEYITPTEGKGFSLIANLSSNGQQQHVADITVERDPTTDQITLQTQGDAQIYGPDYYYTSRMGYSDAVFYVWLFGSHPLYASPWYYRHYPRWYRAHRPVPSMRYQERMAVRHTAMMEHSRTSVVRPVTTVPVPRRPAERGTTLFVSPKQNQHSGLPQERVVSKPVGNGGPIRSANIGTRSTPVAPKPPPPPHPSSPSSNTKKK